MVIFVTQHAQITRGVMATDGVGLCLTCWNAKGGAPTI
jgi:hypothetical protein